MQQAANRGYMWTNKKRKRIIALMMERRNGVIGTIAGVLVAGDLNTTEELFDSGDGS